MLSVLIRAHILFRSNVQNDCQYVRARICARHRPGIKVRLETRSQATSFAKDLFFSGRLHDCFSVPLLDGVLLHSACCFVVWNYSQHEVRVVLHTVSKRKWKLQAADSFSSSCQECTVAPVASTKVGHGGLPDQVPEVPERWPVFVTYKTLRKSRRNRKLFRFERQKSW